MLVRVILLTLILGGTMGVNLAWGSPEDLTKPYLQFIFTFIAALYSLNIIYAALLRYAFWPKPLFTLQASLDLIGSAVLVHFTGGADSAFVLLFLFAPISSAVVFGRRASLLTALFGNAVIILVSVAGYFHWLPILVGQQHLPWALTLGQLGNTLLINCTAMIAIALLAGYLSEQLRATWEKVARQQADIEYLATLNMDIVRSLTSGLLTVDEQGRILTLNQMAREILSLEEKDFSGETLSTIVPELAKALSKDEVRRAEVKVERGPKSLLLGVSISRLVDNRGQSRGRIMNFQDLTNLRRMEEAYKRSAHLASLGRMAAGIAHELRNPLGAISGSLELLKGESELSQENQKLMGIALREIERLNQLVTDFLEYARPAPPKLERLDLHQEIPELVGSIAGLRVGANMPRVIVEKKENNLWIKADRAQLISVLWNLVRNATEAGESKEVTISVGKWSEKFVCLAVRDQGEGLTSTQLEHLFEPFYTTKAQGTGLGLATVHRIIDEHAGMIEVSSIPGQGTTFNILLPKCD